MTNNQSQIQIFDYPINEEDFQEIQGVEHIRIRLKVQAKNLNVKFQYFKITNIRNKYIYCKCNCKAQLKYRKSGTENSYKLILFRNKHRHKPAGHSTQIASYIKGMPTTMELSSMKNLVRRKFPISNAQFYYYNAKVIHQKMSFKELINILDDYGYETKYVPFPLTSQQIPNIILTVSQQMKELFQKYGQIISFDVTYNLVKETYIPAVEQGRQIKPRGWGLALFAGKNNNNNPVVFGVALINTETTQALIDLFGSFFDLMKSEPTANVISDQQWSIIAALAQLKSRGLWEGEHFLDSFHILRNLRKNVGNGKLYQVLHEAMMETQLVAYNQLIERAKKQIQSEKDARIFQNFMKNAPKYCLSQTPPVFQGLSISTSYHEKLHDIIKSHIKYANPAAVALRKIINICIQVNQKSKQYKLCTAPLQEIFHSYKLKLLRFSVCEGIFRKIIENYAASLPLVYFEKNQDTWIFQNPKMTQTVKIRDRILTCSCNYHIKTGIPCIHLLKIIEDIREDILNYVDSRWRIEQKGQTNNKQPRIINKRGRPKLSRRNG